MISAWPNKKLLFLNLEISRLGVGEVAQLVKHSLCKHEGLNLVLRTQVKMLSMWHVLGRGDRRMPK